MWPLSPVKTESTWRGRQRTTSPYIINETSKAIHPFIQAASTTEFSILALDMTGLRFCSWEPPLCVASASMGPLPFI